MEPVTNLLEYTKMVLRLVIRNLLLFPLLMITLVSSPSWAEVLSDLVQRDGIYYKKFSNEPFTGRLEGKHQVYIKDGKRWGEWFEYYANGQLFSHGWYQANERHGRWVFYLQDGSPHSETYWVNGVKDGRWELYNRDGTIHHLEIWKNGVKERDVY